MLTQGVHVIDKYGIKDTGSWKNVQENIRGTCEQTRTDGKYTRRQRYDKANVRELYVRMTEHIFGTN